MQLCGLKCKLISFQGLHMIFKVSQEEKKIREELRVLRKELAGISAVDEFARYARTQRKLNKVEEQVLSYGQSRMDGRESLRWKVTKAIQAINVCKLVLNLRLEFVDLTDFIMTGRRSSLSGHHSTS